MSTLNLIVPGLLGPFSNDAPNYISEQLQQPEFNLLRSWLSHSRSEEIKPQTFYQTLQSKICPQSNLSLCQLTADFDQIKYSSENLYRLDPVHFKAESDHAVLLGSDLLGIEKEEALQLIEAFNQHFIDESIKLHFGDLDRWYLETARPLQLSFNSKDYSLGRDIKHFMPVGDDALWWRKILNETQMLFFAHEINQQREDNAQLSINGLWLWDSSFESTVTEFKNNAELFADDDLIKSMARQSFSSVNSLNDFFDNRAHNDKSHEDITVVIDEIYEAVCYGDVDAWVESLENFCTKSLPEIARLLNSKVIKSINLYPCDGRQIYIDRLQLLKFWKRTMPLNNYIAISK